MKLVKCLFAFLFVCAANGLRAQDVEMADTLRAEGKIYVVVGIILIIFAGLIIYLVSIDRKVSRLEKRLPDKAK